MTNSIKEHSFGRGSLAPSCDFTITAIPEHLQLPEKYRKHRSRQPRDQERECR
jgi:hypothetical protein